MMGHSAFRWRERCNVMVMMGVMVMCMLLALLLSLRPQQTQDASLTRSVLAELQQVSSLLDAKAPSSPRDVNTQPATDYTFVGLEMTDSRLIAYARSQMTPPSPLPYNLTFSRRVHFSQYDQSDFAEKNFFNGMGGGFFVEVGALDGEDKSNSLYFEKYRGWTGLLIEPDPKLYATLSSLHRKAYSIRTGLSFSTRAGKADFRPARGAGRVRPGVKGGVSIKMLPLYTLLLALNVTQVDLFSLDIEGDEMKVLQTLPWDSIRFRILCIEINHVPGGTKGMIKFLEPLGYTFLGVRNIDAWFGWRDLLKETMNVDKYLKENGIEALRQKILHR